MIIDEAKLELIKKDEYTFTDEEVGEIYAMTKSVVKEYFKKSNDFEDVVQTIITKFFSYSIKKFNINKNIKFSTYAFICLKNLTLMEIRCRNKKKNQMKEKYKNLKNINKVPIVLQHGNNPGLVSHFVKAGLEYIVNTQFKKIE